MDEPFIVRDEGDVVGGSGTRSESGAAVGFLFNQDDSSERIVLFDDPIIAQENTVNTSLYTPIEQRIFYPWGSNNTNNTNHHDDSHYLDDHYNRDSFRFSNGGSNNNNTTNNYLTELVGVNYLNLVSYLIGQVFLTVGIGLWDFHHVHFITKHVGITTTWDFLLRYDTLLRPYFWTYEYLFCIIIFWQGIFVVCQLFPYFASRSIIQEEIRYSYFYLCICQGFYTIFCSTHHIFGLCYLSIIGSFLSILGVFLCLLILLIRFYKRNNERAERNSSNRREVIKTKRQEYWLFRFPFLLYMGWTIPMLVLHFTILFRILDKHNEAAQPANHENDDGDDSKTVEYYYLSLQLSSNIVSITLLFMMACLFILFGGPPFARTDITIPFIILHFFIGIALRLQFEPSKDLLNMYGTTVINSMRDTIWILSGLLLCMIIPRFVIFAYREFCTIHLVSLNEEEEEEEEEENGAVQHNYNVMLNM